MLKRILTWIIISVCWTLFINSGIWCATKTVELKQDLAKLEQTAIQDVALDENTVKEEKKLAGQDYSINFFVLILKAVFSLLIISGLIYFVLRFFLKGQRWLTKQQGLIQIIGTHPLTPNKYIQIIEIGNKLLVLGISDHSINLLTEIRDKEEIDFIKIQFSRQEDKMQLSFIQHLKERISGGEIKQTSYEEKLQFLNKQRERLKKLES
ncbi:MAG: flagellar biosynthetic protein FliO [bacterium]|nr:flagellar biosynthetic protein FliO [bacterium]